MSLENEIFIRNFKFRARFINVCIMRIRYGHRNTRTVNGYKMYIFKMMRDIVIKNICNFENLIRSTTCVEPPTRDELLTDCYIMFDKCISKFKVSKTNNFYYYFNKSLSRKFYRDYQREVKLSSVELSDAMIVVHPKLRDNGLPDTMSVIFDNLNFSETEIRIAVSRINEQRTSEFLKENEDISGIQYYAALKRMKDLIIKCRECNQY